MIPTYQNVKQLLMSRVMAVFYIALKTQLTLCLYCTFCLNKFSYSGVQRGHRVQNVFPHTFLFMHCCVFGKRDEMYVCLHFTLYWYNPVFVIMHSAFWLYTDAALWAIRTYSSSFFSVLCPLVMLFT